MYVVFRMVNDDFSNSFGFVVYIFNICLEFDFFFDVFDGQVINNFVFVWFIVGNYLCDFESCCWVFFYIKKVV